jgi:hypothetical protein
MAETSLSVDEILEEDRAIITKYLTPSAAQPKSKKVK